MPKTTTLEERFVIFYYYYRLPLFTLPILFQFVEQIVRNLKEAIREGQWESARLIVRFISDMVNCHIVSASSLLQLYDSFIDAAMEQGVPQVRRDW